MTNENCVNISDKLEKNLFLFIVCHFGNGLYLLNIAAMFAPNEPGKKGHY